MTVPRELSMRDGKLCQQPAHEIERMRGDCVRATGGETVEEPGRLFDLVVSCEGAKMVELEIRKGVFVRYTDGMLTLDMGDEGYGRDRRSIELSELRDLRVLSDTTMVEIFANGEPYLFAGGSGDGAACRGCGVDEFLPPRSLTVYGARLDLLGGMCRSCRGQLPFIAYSYRLRNK